MNGSNVPLKTPTCKGCVFLKLGTDQNGDEGASWCTRTGASAPSGCSRYTQHKTEEAPKIGVVTPAKGFEKFSEQAAQQSAEGRGLRFNAGKVRVDLVPPDAIWALAQLMTVNSHKYPDRNWEKGMPISEVLASCERHLLALKSGEDIDPTDNQPHAVKIMWNGMALTSYLLRGVGTDDRVKFPLPEQRPLPEVIG